MIRSESSLSKSLFWEGIQYQSPIGFGSNSQAPLSRSGKQIKKTARKSAAMVPAERSNSRGPVKGPPASVTGNGRRRKRRLSARIIVIVIQVNMPGALVVWFWTIFINFFVVPEGAEHFATNLSRKVDLQLKLFWKSPNFLEYTNTSIIKAAAPPLAGLLLRGLLAIFYY